MSDLEMSELDSQLRQYLDATAPVIDVDTVIAGLGAVHDPSVVDAAIPVFPIAEPPQKRRGRSRRLALVAAVTVLVVGLAIVLVDRDAGAPTLDTDAEVTVADARDPAADPSIVPLPRPPGSSGATLEWELGRVPDADPGRFVQILSDGKMFYWIGDELATSLDGVVWDDVEFDTPSSGPTLLQGPGATAVWGGQLVRTDLSPGLGSGFGDSDVIVEIVGIDGTVARSTLSPDLAAGADAKTVAEIQSSSAVIGPRGLAVTARLSVQDYEPLLRDVLGDDADSVTSVSVDRQVAEATLVAELPGRSERIVLDAHGVSERDFEVPPTGPIGWHSTDGISWTAIPTSGPFATGNSVVITATSSGFFAVARSTTLSAAGTGWFSADGVAWALVEGQPVCCEAFGWSDGALLAIEGGGFQFADADGVDLLAGSDAEEVAENNRSVGAGEAGIAHLADTDRAGGPDHDIVYSPDGVSWARQMLPAGIGSLYCCWFDNYGVVVGSESVAVLSESEGQLELWLGTPTTGEES